MFMQFLALFFLGIIQGLTEFLPVSSSGHLVLFSKLFGIEESLFVSVLLHGATLCSILVCFAKDIWQMIRNPFSKQTISLAVATLPTCVLVLVFMPLLKRSFAGGLLPVCFALSALVLFVAEVLSKNKQLSLNYKTAFFMGVAQGFAIFPGLSRSGTTISAGLATGADKKSVAKFSFLMSVPIIFVSLIGEIVEVASNKQSISLPVSGLIVSFLVAFLIGVLSIKIMVRLTERANLKWFSVYLIFVSMFSLFLFF